MTEYKDLIDALRAWHNSWFSPNVYENYSIFGRAANAIEQLQKERDAAIRDMTDYQGNICAYCKHFRTEKCIWSSLKNEDYAPLTCGKFEWRGIGHAKE